MKIPFLTTSRPNEKRLRELLDGWAGYQRSRMSLLGAIGVAASNRDPLSEFSEVLVAAILGARKAENRVQKGYDLSGPKDERIEVKYLSNPLGSWVNWHVIRTSESWDKYAIVFFEELMPKAVIVFQRFGIPSLYKALNKRHKHAEQTLEITVSVYSALRADPRKYSALGVEVYPL